MNVNDNQQTHRQTHRLFSWWSSPFVGYFCALLLTGGAFLLPYLQSLLGIHNSFVGAPFILVTLLVGSLWGTGPALFSIIGGALAVDYWIVNPAQFEFAIWPDGWAFVLFLLVQFTVLRFVQMNRKNQQKLVQSNAQLEQADRVKDQFFSMASHELRTPVTSIHGYIQLLQRRIKKQNAQNPELLPVYDSLGKIDEQTRRLTDLVNDLLDINSLRSGKMPFRLAPCDLRSLFHEVVENQKALTDRPIDLHLPTDPVVVHIDERRFSQVVINLVTNALKYSSANTMVRVEVSQKPGEAILAVHNEGPVLSKEQQETIFEPFYRSPDAQSSTTPGWGLGLAISQAIVEQHHGRLWVESSEGKGTTFFVALPLRCVTGAESLETR